LEEGEAGDYDWYPANDAAPVYIKDYTSYLGELPNLIEEIGWTVGQIEGVYKN